MPTTMGLVVPSGCMHKPCKDMFPNNRSRGARGEKSPLLGDGAVDVRDHHLVVPVPQVDGGLTAARALVLGCHAERHLVRTILQIQPSLGAGGTKWYISMGSCQPKACHWPGCHPDGPETLNLCRVATQGKIHGCPIKT